MSSKKWHVMSAQQNEDEIQSINIFGYQCKIFRDDEKAMFIDQGKHLIPWMGDATLMIDRYDGRGHIYDLVPYDSENVDNHQIMLSDREKAVEKACDEERYLELNTDLMQQQTYEEEEMKRLYEAMGEGYSAVGFNYDQSQVPQPQPQIQQKPATEEDEDDPYETIPELQVPKGVNLPRTIKMHAIIEKTADFVAKQGQQMEIIVATKQTNNPQFRFLHYSHELNVYYKHLVNMIKKGRYKPPPQETYNRLHRRRSSESHQEGHGYLHPSLGGTTEPEVTPMSSENFLHSVTAKLPSGQIANTAYAKLLSNIKKHRPESPVPPAPKPKEPPRARSHTPEPKATDTQQRHNGRMSHNQPPVPGTDQVTLPGPNQPPPPGTVPPEPPPQGHYPTVGYTATADNQASQYTDGQPMTGYEYYPHSYGPMHGPQPYPGYNGAVAHTNEDSSSSYTDTNTTLPQHRSTGIPVSVVIPPDQSRPIIDKMAEYVVRNGPEFEMMMRNKNDERFTFLQSWHEYNPYYEYKREQCRVTVTQQGQGQPKVTTDQGQGSGSDSDSSDDDNSQGTGKGVSFSIKTKEPEATTIAPKRALLGDSDDDDDDDTSQSRGSEDQNTGSESDRKTAAESLKNKLALAARGKMVAAKEEEKVKAERKKKAAMFAALLKTNVPGTSSPSPLPVSASAPNLSSLGAGSDVGSDSPALSASPGPQLPVAVPATIIGPIEGSVKSPARSTTEEQPHIVDSSDTESDSSRSRSRSPSVVITAETFVPRASRSQTPSKSKHSASLARRKSRSRSRERHRRSRSRDRSHKTKRSRRSPRRRGRSPVSPPLPSAYSSVRRSSSPSKKLSRKRHSSRSPSHKHSARSSKNSRRSRDRSEERSKKSRRSRSPTKSSRSKSKKKRERSRDRKKSKKSKKKPKMIPIPELTPPPGKVSSSDSEAGETAVPSSAVSNTHTPTHDLGSDSEVSARPPSENILSKVRAMLKAQRDQLLRDDAD